MSDLVRNPEDRFSQNEAHIVMRRVQIIEYPDNEEKQIIHGYIMLTSPSNEDPPYTPLLYIKTGVYMGIHFFLIFHSTH